MELIINADDFGISETVNEAIEQTFARGQLSSTTIMAGGKYYEQAAGIALRHKITTGVHLTLCGDEQPVHRNLKEINSLVDKGGRLRKNYLQFIKDCLLCRINYEQVELELQAQISKVKNDIGYISHLDSHQHLHVWPPIAEIVIRLAKINGIESIRVPQEMPGSFIVYDSNSLFRKYAVKFLSRLSASLRLKLRRNKIRCTKNFCGMLSGGCNTVDILCAYISQMVKQNLVSCELMLHPATDNVAMQNEYGWNYDWESEYAALLDQKLKKIINANNIIVSNFKTFNGDI